MQLPHPQAHLIQAGPQQIKGLTGRGSRVSGLHGRSGRHPQA
jgi:hypothetical protein